ncbi:septum formation initiator [Roseinatronobacter thiooxidans]|jgi:cell division protein FtsB|uniref:Septum formation initiator n=1 Tax=Roseinatronobacter thiooxidans TaxID=121821 RepID=A0A2W7R1G6_9RHOB|nr:septum formation initiator family protein [Roseinatronobacter thiooxidans]PZX47959.1 septum formation initiator [Roseinatronobacter thiooxidans]
MKRSTPAIGPLFYFGTAIVLGLYFTFAAVQGAFGLFNRVQIEAEITGLQAQRDRLRVELAEVENRTRRLSDDFLDLDLLDERARSVLGLARPDEIIIR